MADAAGRAETAHVCGLAMKFCVIIPCYNHPAIVAKVAGDAQAFCPVIIVDDGSTPPVSQIPGCEIVRLETNSGKGDALRAGFKHALDGGFSHAITMDADAQHFASDLPKFLEAARAKADALVVGIRDIREAGAPWHRQVSNFVSSFWFCIETRLRLRDTQCGFRCYPLELTKQLQIKSGRYAFELEIMVRAIWIGTPVAPVPVKCTYERQQIRQSHFRPVVDLMRIAKMNFVLVVQSLVIPRKVRALWSLGKSESRRQMLRDFFSENTQDPGRLALAVAVGLFCGIAPLWGVQMVTTLALAHWLRLNKVIALIASNISIPPVVPFILYGELLLGHWMVTGDQLNFTAREMTFQRAFEYFGQWCVGSLVLAIALAISGGIVAYCLARVWRKNEI